MGWSGVLVAAPATRAMGQERAKSRAARELVEWAGLVYFDKPYIADAVRNLGGHA